MAQAVIKLGDGPLSPGDSAALALAAGALHERLARERDPMVLAAIASSIGRWPYRSARDVQAAESDLTSLLEGNSSTVVTVGVARGLESLMRNPARVGAPSSTTVSLLGTLIGDRAATPGVRRLALAALTTADAVDAATLSVAAVDPDPQVRRLAGLAAARFVGTAERERTLRALLHDREPMVRVEAVRSWARQPDADCSPLLQSAVDTAPHVSLTAIDLLPAACRGPARSGAESLLVRLVHPASGGTATGRTVPARVAAHRAAHAIVALALVSPPRARDLLAGVAASPMWQLRMYAARAAAELSDAAALEMLARDEDANVRTAALSGLTRVEGHGADSIYLAALADRDYQLVLTAAHAIRGTPSRDAASRALMAALARITAERRDTSRDPRLAILASLGELGSDSATTALAPYLADFDPVLADSVADLLSRWTGRLHHASPQPLSVVDRPLDDRGALKRARVRFTMAPVAGGGWFELRLFPDDAPATVGRFVRLARAGYYDGLTFHRVVADFVVQGGSPGANEYMGDGPYMRDEVGLRSHERGTVGISTRGRDTGDAQIFINLVDNPRLDHQFTVFAEVTAGMATVDQLLEGDEIAKVEIVSGR